MFWSSSVFHPCCLQIHHRLPPDLGFALHRNPNRTPRTSNGHNSRIRIRNQEKFNFSDKRKKFRIRLSPAMPGWVNSELQISHQKIVCQSSEVSARFLKFLQNFHRPYLIAVRAEFLWDAYSVEADWEKNIEKKEKKEKLISTSASTSRRAPLSPFQWCLSYPYLILILLVTITVLGHV